MRKIILNITILFTVVSFSQESFTMDEAVNYALKNAYAIKNANHDIDLAKEKKWETTTIGLPQVNAKVDYQNFLKQQVSLLPAEFFGGPAGTYAEAIFGTKQTLSGTATISQLLFDGSYLVGLQSAKAYLKISELAKTKTEKSIREAVINAYGNVLLTRESLRIIQNNLAVVNKNIHDTQKMFENGFSEEQDVEQLQITKSTLDTQLQRTNQLLPVALNLLKITMGMDMNKEIELKDNLDSLSTKNIDLVLMNQEFTIDNHIDYKIAKNQITSNELLVKYQKSKALPSLSAFLNYGVTANSNTFSFYKSDQRWFDSSLFGVSLNIPIFSSFMRRANTNQAKIELEKATNNFNELKQKLNLQVAQAKADYQFAVANFQIIKNQLALSKRIEKKEQIKFTEGIGSSFNLSQAQNQLYTSQQSYLNAIVQIINSKIKLENALNN